MPEANRDGNARVPGVEVLNGIGGKRFGEPVGDEEGEIEMAFAKSARREGLIV